MNSKTLKIWVAVNKNGYVGLYEECPKRNEEVGKWESKFPFCNPYIYKNLSDMVSKVMTWESDPEYFEINFNNESSKNKEDEV